VGIYEVTLVYPDLDYDEHRRFLGSVAASRPSGLDGFRRHGPGIALTFVIRGNVDASLARKMALQRATGLWPNFRPGSANLEVLDDLVG
jgi:hypothetical protein